MRGTSASRLSLSIEFACRQGFGNAARPQRNNLRKGRRFARPATGRRKGLASQRIEALFSGS
jgi:hypothetical protein